MFSNSYLLLRSLLIKSNKSVHKNITKEIHRSTQASAVRPSNISFNTFNVFSSNTEILLAYNAIRVLSNKYVSKSTEKPTCWSCKKVNCVNTDPIFCVHCNTIQEPNRDKNYFQVIGIEMEFDLDEGNLTKKYKDLQKFLHPDKFSTRTETEQKISAEYSSLVNKAYATLAQPLSRGIYLLRLKGQEISEETQIESAFLHQIMERNEEVESAETPKEILQINQVNKATISELVAKLTAAFKTNDLSTAKNILIHMKYFVSIEQQIKDIIRKMGIVQ